MPLLGLEILAAIGGVGVLDVLFFHGQIGVVLSHILPF